MPDEEFVAVFREEYRSLVALGTALTGRFDLGEELAQEALLRAYRDWSNVSTYDRPGAWMRRVLINLATDRRRRQASERRAVDRIAATPPQALDQSTDAWWEAVRSLPDRQRTIVTLHYLEDRSVRSIAELLGIAEGTVKATLAHARTALAAQLAKEDT